MKLKKIPILLLALSAVLAGQTDPSGRVGRLSFRSGPVSFQPAGVTDWVEADLNRPLTTGDQVWVGQGGRAEIHVGSTALRLDSNTAFQFLNLDDRTIQIQLTQGNLTVRARSLGQDQVLELDTPNSAFNVFHPGEYRVTVTPDDQTTNVTVHDGGGEVTSGGQTFPIQFRQRAIVAGGDQVTYDLVNAPRLDWWDQWNASRDHREDASPSARYVSREVGGYEDLDQYGSWGQQPGYGEVWMPTKVAAGWTPYHDGHWAWVAPWGWTWVDEAPWGFAPSHYGRWASFGGRWGWVPGPREETPLYAPALVAWIGGGGGNSGFSLSFSSGNAPAIGWFPLGPREPYLPSYNVTPSYFGRVNTSNTVINTTTINNYYNQSQNSNNTTVNNIQYANRNVQNAVVAVPQNSFASGRRVAESARAVPPAQAIAARFVPAPAIAPQRASVLGPRASEAARAPRPPAALINRPVVARTPPPPAPVAFERQQAALSQNPGRPLAPAAVRQLISTTPARSAPVQVMDMSRVQRVQPKLGAGPQQGANRVILPPGKPAATAVQAPNGPRPNQPAPAAVTVAPPARGALPTPNTPQPNPTRAPSVTPPPPAVINRTTPSPSNPAGRQIGQPPQQNAPQPRVISPPTAPPPAITNRQAPPPVPPSVAPSNDPRRKSDRSGPAPATEAPKAITTRPPQTAPAPVPARPASPPPPNAAPRTAAPMPTVPPRNAAPPPSVPPPNAARPPAVPPPNAARQPAVPAPNVVRQPAVPAPSIVRPPSAPPPSRQEPPAPKRAEPPTRPQAQVPQHQPPRPGEHPPAKKPESEMPPK